MYRVLISDDGNVPLSHPGQGTPGSIVVSVLEAGSFDGDTKVQGRPIGSTHAFVDIPGLNRETNEIVAAGTALVDGDLFEYDCSGLELNLNTANHSQGTQELQICEVPNLTHRPVAPPA